MSLAQLVFSQATPAFGGWGGKSFLLKDTVVSGVTFKIRFLYHSRDTPFTHIYTPNTALSPNGIANIFKAQLDGIRRGGEKEFGLSLLGVNDPVRCNFFYFILLPRKSITAL